MNNKETIKEALKRAKHKWGITGWNMLDKSTQELHFKSEILNIICARSDSEKWNAAGSLAIEAIRTFDKESE